MPQIEGSLSRRVLDIVRFGNGKVAGMVIDEQGANHEKTKEQMIMLRKLAVWRCPIFLVEFETESDRLTPLPTKPELRLAACDDTLKETANSQSMSTADLQNGTTRRNCSVVASPSATRMRWSKQTSWKN